MSDPTPPDVAFEPALPQTRVPELKAALAISGTQRRRLHVIKWVAITTGSLLLAASLFSLADYLLVLGWYTRGAFFLVILAGLVIGVRKALQRRRLYDDVLNVAREVEAADPRLGCMLSTAIEYGEWDADQFKSRYEALLVDNLLQQATGEQSSIQPDRRKLLLRPLAIGITGLILALLFLCFMPQSTVAVRRLLTPWTSTAYTTLKVTPGTADIPEGRDVDLSITFGGRLPREAQIAYIEEGQGWKTLPLKKISTTQYRHVFHNLRSPIRYRIVATRVDSPTFELTPFRSPEVKAWTLTLRYPKYAQLADRVQNLPDVSVVRATEVLFHVAMQEQVKSLALDFGGKERLDLLTQPGDSGSAKQIATLSYPFWLEITDLQGRVTRSPAPYQFVVLPDTAPKITITLPAKNIRVRPEQKVPIEISTIDDFGLGSLQLIYKRLGEAPQQLACTVQDLGAGRGTAKLDFDVAKLGFKMGDVIVYFAQGADCNDLDGPGKGKSQAYFIELTPAPREADSQDMPDQNQTGAQQLKKEKIDLYELQKEILRATMVAGEEASPDDLRNLADEQAEVNDLGERFKKLLQENGVKDAKLLGLVDQARGSMTQATEALRKPSQPDALPHEELAVQKLAELMAIISPELLMKINQQLRQEMVKKEAQEEKQQQDQIEKMLQQVNQLAQEQTKLNEEKKDDPQQDQQDAQDQQPQDAEAPEPKQQDPKDVAEAQKQLAQKTQELAEKARKQRMNQVGKELTEAKGEMVEGNGEQSVGKLLDAATALRLLKERGVPDPSAETYPGEYEGVIAAYFHKLSKEE